MDLADVRQALKSIDWSRVAQQLPKPRPWNDFFNTSRFKLPSRGSQHWLERVSCNLSFYQTNYLMLVAATLVYAALDNLLFALALAATTAAFYYAWFIDRSVLLTGEKSRLTLKQYVPAALLLLMWVFAGWTLFWVMGTSASLILAHASVRARSMKNKMFNLVDTVRGTGLAGSFVNTGSDDESEVVFGSNNDTAAGRAREQIRNDARGTRLDEIRAKYRGHRVAQKDD